jgi:4-alpha-glucanotransferase
VHLQPPGTYQSEQRRPKLANGRPDQAPTFFRTVEKELAPLPFIAEDLGLITPDVSALRDQFRLPGMRVLQFAFDGKSDNPTCLPTIRSILSCTLAPTIIPRLAVGSKIVGSA